MARFPRFSEMIHSTEEYGWIDNGAMKVLRRDYMPNELSAIMKANGIEETVVVQARQSLEETRWLLELAKNNEFIKGVVGWVDLCGENVREELVPFADNFLLRGIRHLVQDEPDDQFMLRTDFLRGLSILGNFNIVYDVVVFPRHLAAAVEAVRQFPNQNFVLDHIAKPVIREGKMQPWRADIERLASFPNVYCKVSGLVTEAHWKKWKVEDFFPYLDVISAAFGSNRLMFGSDWPVCTTSGSYEEVRGIVERYFTGVNRLSEDEERGLWGDNARRAYGLS